jgi:hypothetical protein
VADDHHRTAGQPCRPGHECRIVGKEPIAVELDVLLEDRADVVQRVWPLGMAGNLDPLPGREPGRRGRTVRRRELRVLL